MADKIVTVQQLIDANGNCQSWEKYWEGGEDEDVHTIRGKQYPTHAKGEKLRLDNGGYRGFKNKDEILAYKPSIPHVVVKDLETFKLWQWDGTQWHDTGSSELDQAKEYINDLVVNVNEASAGSLNRLNMLGKYILRTPNIYTDLPPDFILDEMSILSVESSADGYFEQHLHKLNSPNNVWTRTCRVSDGVGIWRSAANRYQRAYDNIDPKTINTEGAYVVTNPQNMPLVLKSSLFIDVARFGGFITRTAYSTNFTLKWEQHSDGTWVQVPTYGITTVTAGSANSLSTFGNYILPVTGSYSDLPPEFVLDEMCILTVLPSTGGYFEQRLHKLNSPNNVWIRTCRVSDGVGIWREPFNRFQRSYDSIDPKTITIAGTYVVTNPQNMPVGFSGAALLIVERIGGFTVRSLVQTDGFKSWKNSNNNAWVSSDTSMIGNSRLTLDYNFRGLQTDGDFNNYVSEGNYLVNGSKLNAPDWMTDTAFLTVSRMGSFVVQRATSSKTINLISQRRGTQSAGVWGFGDWAKIGNISEDNGGSTSSLANKTIAVIGDSIVEQGDWPERLADRYGATIHKYGFGGCRAAAYPSNPLGYDKQCLYNIAKCINTNDYSSLIAGAEYTRDHHNDDNTPQAMAMSRVDWNAVDILCIAFGTNDWTGSVLGSDFTVDSTGGSFIGALCFSIEQVLEKFPHIQIVLIGMSFRLRGNGNADENSDNWLNKFGHSLQEYQNAILDVAEKYHIPAFDMYRLSGVNELTYKKYLRDGVHPIPNTGYQHWANKIGSFLNSVI